MTNIIVAFDPGVTTGFAAWGEDGLITSSQGSIIGTLRTWTPWLKKNRPAMIAVEAAFVGVNARSSLMVADSGGFIEGWLSCAGLASEVTRPMPAHWRKVIGIAPTKEGEGFTKAGKPRRVKRLRPELEADAIAFANAHSDRRLTAGTVHEAEAICIASAGWEQWVSKAA